MRREKKEKREEERFVIEKKKKCEFYLSKREHFTGNMKDFFKKNNKCSSNEKMRFLKGFK